MSIELKLGRPVITGDNLKGFYVVKDQDDLHGVLCDDGLIRRYTNVKPDLSAPPMNGDEVEGSNYTVDRPYNRIGRYLGITSDEKHAVEFKGEGIVVYEHVRHPKPEPTKRERLIKYLDKIGVSAYPEKAADAIEKIYEV